MAARFSGLLELLERHHVRFIVIGGGAMVLHGASYTTEDLDVLYERSQQNCERLASALFEIDARLRLEGQPQGLPFAVDAKALRAGMNFTLMTSLGDFDVFGEVPGVGSYDAAAGRKILRRFRNLKRSPSSNVRLRATTPARA